MSDNIKAGGVKDKPAASLSPSRRLVPMKIGEATVYIEQVGEAVEVEADDSIYAVAPSPKQAFEMAIAALKQCVSVVGEQIKTLSGKAMPRELEIEFSLTFDAKAKGTLIPIFVTAEHGLQTGLKVKAVWKREETTSAED